MICRGQVNYDVQYTLCLKPYNIGLILYYTVYIIIIILYYMGDMSSLDNSMQAVIHFLQSLWTKHFKYFFSIKCKYNKITNIYCVLNSKTKIRNNINMENQYKLYLSSYEKKNLRGLPAA